MAKKRNYSLEYQNYHSKPEQIANRSDRNQARAAMVKAGKAHKGDGKDVDHKTPIVKGGGNNASNLQVKSKSANRSFARTKSARMK